MRVNEQIQRVLFDQLPGPDKRRLVIVTGARQTGKTTLLKQRYPSLRYVNLDAVENRDWVRGLSTFGWAEAVGNAVIDEAQKEPSVFEKVKFAFDEGSLSFTALSGSAQLLLLKNVRESLAGRAFVFELWPLMFNELAAFVLKEPLAPLPIAGLEKGESLAALLAALPASPPPERIDSLRAVQAHMLEWGGMPELLRLDDAERTQWLKSYEITYLERDLGDLVRLHDLEPFKKFQKLAALRSGRQLSYSELAKDAGVATETARRYLEYLRLSYQAFLLPPYHENLTSQVVKTPKLYWSDTGLLRHLSGRPSVTTGEIFETFVVAELVKWIRTSGSSLRLFYYRTRSGLEADLLIEVGGKLAGVEIKARAAVDAGDAGRLCRIAEAAGDRWLGGMVVHSGTTMRPLREPNIWAVPAMRLLSGY